MSKCSLIQLLLTCCLFVLMTHDSQVHAQDQSTDPSQTKHPDQQQSSENASESKTNQSGKSLPVYNYSSFEGTRAAALNAGLFLCQNRIDDAFVILGQSTLMNKAQLTQLKDKVTLEYKNIINKQLGVSQGPEIIDEQRKGEHLYRVRMIDRRVLRPVFWELIYYKTQGQWRLAGVSYHTQIQKAFD